MHNTAMPVVLVTGVAADAMAATTIAAQWDLPNAAAVHYRLDVDDQRLTRCVSDAAGVVELIDLDLHHACLGCTLREDIVETLDSLAARHRWESVIAQLPVGIEAVPVSRALAQAARVRLAGVVAAVEGTSAVEDLLGGDLLCERGLHAGDDDDRGVGEACAAIVEYADVIAVAGEAGQVELDLIRALARPEALVVEDGTSVAASHLLTGVHDHHGAEAWVAHVRREPHPDRHSPYVWTVELVSDRPFHPDRLRERIELIGGGPRRSRGCFWLPSRPQTACAWDGAGGQLSIGVAEAWGRGAPFTRIVVTGLDDGRAEIEAAFEYCLLSDAETRRRGMYWEVADDGFEPWLGDVRGCAR